MCADDENMSITYAGDLARAIHFLIKKNSRGVFHINSPQHKTRFKWARDFFDYFEISNAKIKRCSIDDFNFIDKRPKNAFLDSSKFIRETGFEFTPIDKFYELVWKENS